MSGHELIVTAEALEAYCRGVLAWQDCSVERVEPLAGGQSRKAWQATVVGVDGDPQPQQFILRLDPDVSVMDSQRGIEYAVLAALSGAPGVPVPRAICVEDEASHLGATFLMTGFVDGQASAPALVSDEFEPVGPMIARNVYRTLAGIASFEVGGSGLPEVLQASEVSESATVQLDRWERVLADNPVGPTPGINAAIRHLRRQPPVPDRVTIVHGDYRLGNFLFRRDGSIAAVLDWEMTHLGDPIEDLAWSLHRAWRLPGFEKYVCAYLTEEEAIEVYQQARGGIEIDRSALDWWKVFTCVKSFALLATVTHRFMATPWGKVIGGYVGWAGLGQDELAALDLLDQAVLA